MNHTVHASSVHLHIQAIDLAASGDLGVVTILVLGIILFLRRLN